MILYAIIATLLTLGALIAYANSRFFNMPFTTVLMTGSLMLALMLYVTEFIVPNTIRLEIIAFLGKINYHELVIDGFLGFLLFAGGLTVNFRSLYEQRWEIAIISIFSTLASASIIGFSIFYILNNFLGIQLTLIYCLLFGALISPTDPIGVIAMCKELQAPRKLTTILAGESLFNDGVGIVLFTVLFEFLSFDGQITTQGILLLFLRESIGGILYGLLIGWCAAKLIRSINDYKIAILITLSIATSGYLLALALHISGPLAMAVAGIFVGNQREVHMTSKATAEKLQDFWDIVDEVLDAILFTLLGLSLLSITLGKKELVAAMVCIPLVLIARYITIAVPFAFFRRWRKYNPNIVKILTWGGLRGGLAIALAIALPSGEPQDIIETMTYLTVVFSLIVQGLTIKPLIESSKQFQR